MQVFAHEQNCDQPTEVNQRMKDEDFLLMLFNIINTLKYNLSLNIIIQYLIKLLNKISCVFLLSVSIARIKLENQNSNSNHYTYIKYIYIYIYSIFHMNTLQGILELVNITDERHCSTLNKYLSQVLQISHHQEKFCSFAFS